VYLECYIFDVRPNKFGVNSGVFLPKVIIFVESVRVKKTKLLLLFLWLTRLGTNIKVIHKGK